LLTHPGIDFASFDEEAQISDALAATAFLRSQPGIQRVYLVGHSEGGTLATVMAGRSPGIAGLAVVNSAQFAIDELLLAQLKALSGVSKADYDAIERELEMIKAGSYPKDRLLLGASGAYWAQWIAYSQRSPVMLVELKMPVLLVQCLEDESLPGGMLARNLDRLRAVARTNKSAELRELAGHDHSTLRRAELKASTQFTRTLVQWLDASR
jgi:pimeloyl-ACP methyl ester carboxylesterase